MDGAGMDWGSAEMAGTQPDQPRDPELVRRAEEWAKDHEQRQAEERAEGVKQPEKDAADSVPRPVPSVRGGYGHTPVTYQILEEAMRKLVKDEQAKRHKDAWEVANAILNKMWDTFASARTITTWRLEDAERRIADLEARLAKLEGPSDG